MAVTFVAAGALAGNATQSTQAISAPTCAADDILICQLINKSATANTISAPDGSWTQIVQAVNDCTTAADDHEYAIFWKRATAGDSAASFTFSKATDDNALFAGVISAWRGAATSGSPLDATAAGATPTAGAVDNVSFPAFDPTESDSHVIYMAFYGNDLTTFAAAMSADTNPDCTLRYDLETSTGNDATLACISGDTTDGSSIASRTWASNSTTDAGNTGVVFALKQPPPKGATTVVPSVSGTAKQSHLGTGALALVLALAGSGRAANPVSGTGAITVAPTVSGTAQQKHTGTGAITKAPGLSGEGNNALIAYVYSSTSDGAVYSSSSVSYSAARNAASGSGAFTSDTIDQVGQYTDGAGYYEVWQLFLAFDTSSIGTGNAVTGAVLSLNSAGGNTGDVLECRLYDWGGTVSTTDWVPGTSLSSYTLLGSYDTNGGWGNATWRDFSDDAFAANINRTGTTYVMVHGQRQRTGTTPSGDETVTAIMADDTTSPSRDPLLTIYYTPITPTTGTGAVAVAPAVSGQGKQTNTGTGSVAVRPTLSGTGKQTNTGTGSAAVSPALSGSGTSALGTTGTGSVSVALNLSGTGQQRHTGTGTTAVVASLSGTGSVSGAPTTGSGQVTISTALEGQGKATSSGSGSVTVLTALTGTGQERHTGSGASSFSATLSGSGTATGAPTTGSGQAQVSLTLSGQAQQKHTASGSVAAVLSASGTGQQLHTASGAVSLAALTLSGQARQSHAGTGASDALLALAGAGSVANPSATGQVQVGITLAGQAKQANSGAGQVTLAFALAGAGSVIDSVTGSGAASLSLDISGSSQQANSGAGSLTVPSTSLGSGLALSAVTGAGDVSISLTGTGAGSNIAAYYRLTTAGGLFDIVAPVTLTDITATQVMTQGEQRFVQLVDINAPIKLTDAD